MVRHPPARQWWTAQYFNHRVRYQRVPTAHTTTDRLPRGPHRLSREQVQNHQRERILSAVIATVGTKGYGSTTIGDISRHARVSRETFYAQFANKEAVLRCRV